MGSEGIVAGFYRYDDIERVVVKFDAERIVVVMPSHVLELADPEGPQERPPETPPRLWN